MIGQPSQSSEEAAAGNSGSCPPPPGLPQSCRRLQPQEQYLPPPEPPPAHQQYQPPPGPPPSHRWNTITPPQGLSRLAQGQPDSEPPPYHDWTVIPDNALLPPPPSIGHGQSPLSNAGPSEADRAHDWCKAHPIVKPHQPSSVQHGAIAGGDVRLLKAKEFRGDLLMPSTGFWKGSTRSGNHDSCLLTSLPLYFAMADAPTRFTTKIIYYELKVRSFGQGRGPNESSVALGYCAMPYPTWRMPGWERGSLAVHGDDGRKYVNDTWGGKDFTSPFEIGDTIGLGMSFSAPNSYKGCETFDQNKIQVEVFLTRNGKKGESWNLHEELDAERDLGVDGLDGRSDLYAAIGIFGGVEFDVAFKKQDWRWQPR